METYMQLIINIVGYILGAGGLLTIIFNRKQYNSTVLTTQANAMKTMAEVFDKLSMHANENVTVSKKAMDAMQFEMEQMKEQMYMLIKTVEGYKAICDTCPHNRQHLKQ